MGDEYTYSPNVCKHCASQLMVWPDTIDEDMPPEGVNLDTNEFCPVCYGDQN